MENTSMHSLLLADEERVVNTLRALERSDRSCEKSIAALNDELGTLLLRYNSSCVGDRARQAAADGMTATARDSLDLLLSADAKLEVDKRRHRSGTAYLLALALILGAAAVFIIAKHPILAYVCLGGALICAFLSGLLWFREGSAHVAQRLDSESIWRTLKKVTETMDMKLEEQSGLALQTDDGGIDGDKAPLDERELELMGELLEALYTDSGEFALRQLKRLRPYLREKGLELVEYGEDTAEYFEVFPSKTGSATLRPALLYGDRLLMTGRAAAAE